MAGSENKSSKNIILCGLLILSPVFILAVFSFIYHKNFFLAVPTWSDELDYFREMYSFSKHGFNFGGSLFVGYDAAAGPLGGHSISPLIAYGLFALIFPWTEHSILIINIFWLMLAWTLFTVLVKPSGKPLIYALLLAYLYTPIHMYIYTSMMEIPCYAGIIIYFTLFVRFMRSKSNKDFAWLMVVGSLVTLLRMTYIVILFPAIFAKTDYKFNLKTLRNMAIYVVAFLAVYKVYNIFCAEYPDWVTVSISEAPGTVNKLKVVFGNSMENLVRYFSLDASISQTTLRYSYAILVLITGVFSFKKREEKLWVKQFDGYMFSLFFMSLGLWLIMIMLYDIKDWRDYRTFGPIAFFLLLMLLMHKGVNSETTLKAIRYSFFALLILVAFTRVSELTEDRVTVAKADTLTAFDDIDAVEGAKLGITMDINWGDIALAKSVPSDWGYQVFYKDSVAENIDKVDYILTTEEFVKDHPDIFDGLTKVTPVENYGVLYKTAK